LEKGGSIMNHIHKYETLSRHGIPSELMEFGIEAAELRKCKKCGKEMPFLLTKKGDWVPLFQDGETDQQDILLA
jgi:hypothetical protein